MSPATMKLAVVLGFAASCDAFGQLPIGPPSTGDVCEEIVKYNVLRAQRLPVLRSLKYKLMDCGITELPLSEYGMGLIHELMDLFAANGLDIKEALGPSSAWMWEAAETGIFYPKDIHGGPDRQPMVTAPETVGPATMKACETGILAEGWTPPPFLLEMGVTTYWGMVPWGKEVELGLKKLSHKIMAALLDSEAFSASETLIGCRPKTRVDTSTESTLSLGTESATGTLGTESATGGTYSFYR